MNTLRLGSTGEEVKVLQKALGITADGIFGKKTENAVISYQSTHGLVIDGVVGNKTWAALTSSQPKGTIVILDNGHGSNTPGKCSPDKSIREYAYTRDIVKRIAKRLGELGIASHILVPEETDISLGERCRRANAIKGDKILISVHLNAAGGDGQWHPAGGWCAFTTKGQTKSDALAECLYDAAEAHIEKYAAIMAEGKKKGLYSDKQVPIRTDKSDGDRDKEEQFYIIRNVSCPAVLVENFFQDSLRDRDWLLSEEGKQTIVDIHVDGIMRYLKE